MSSLLLLLLATAKVSMGYDTKSCCGKADIGDFCTENFCNIDTSPDRNSVFDVASKCGNSLHLISSCLAGGRNHMPCCRERFEGAYDECLHLCSGTAKPLNTSNWEEYGRYVACLTLNIGNMYSCMRQGYLKSPSRPTEIAVLTVEPTAATLAWKPPKELPEKVEHYRVYYREKDGRHRRRLISYLAKDCTGTVCKIDSLNPNSKYEAYVVALAKGSQLHKSLNSEKILFITKGTEPLVKAFKSHLAGARRGVQTLVCKVTILGNQYLRDIKWYWQKYDPSRDATDLVRSEKGKFEIKSFLSSTTTTTHEHSYRRGHMYFLTLAIHDITTSDFGEYECIAKNKFGSQSATVHLEPNAELVIPSRPPNVTHCCLEEQVSQACISKCSAKVGKKPTDAVQNPSIQCALEVPKILKCSTNGKKYETCCLREKVPENCLPLCDGSLKFPIPFSLYSCLVHATNIISCHLETAKPLPLSPDMVRVAAKTRQILTLQWEEAPKAESYVVYYRTSHSSPWFQVTLTTTKVNIQIFPPKLGSEYEIVVVSVNEAGASDGSRPLFVDVQSFDYAFQKDSPT